MDNLLDLFLEVGNGPEARKFTASSVVLRLVSPVFNVMLGPAFKEGSQTYTELAPLSLPEDNPKIFNLFNDLVHLKKDASNNWEYKKLAGLTVFCDKYDCIHILKLPLKQVYTAFLRSWGGNDIAVESLHPFSKIQMPAAVNICIISYLMGEPEIFAQMTSILAFHSKNAYIYGHVTEELRFLFPARLKGK